MKRKKRDWAAIIEDQEKQGIPIRDYCEAEGIHPTSFYKNRKIHKQRSMVEIPAPARLSEGINPIVLRTGRYSLAIQTGFERDSVKSVLQVIGELE